jgi:hypothetical protein
MKKEISLIAFALILANLGTAHASVSPLDCQIPANAFLAHPNKKSLATLGPNANDQCWTIIGKSNANLKRLLLRVTNGNYSAASYLAANIKTLDGGNLEDALVALGGFSNTHMSDLLAFANKGLITEHELTDALTMLPLSMSDNQPVQLATMQARRNRVSSVTRPELSDQKSVALKAIDDFINEIKASQS